MRTVGKQLGFTKFDNAEARPETVRGAYCGSNHTFPCATDQKPKSGFNTEGRSTAFLPVFDKTHSIKLNLNGSETTSCRGQRAAGHFGHSGHQIGKLFYNASIENFPKPLSYPSNVSNPPLPLDNRATAQPLRQRLT